MSCENKVAELKSELKLKTFELDRANMLNEENINMYQKSSTENEKLQKKIEVKFLYLKIRAERSVLI